MAANYWASTQRRHWQFSRDTLAEIRQQLEDEEPNLAQQYPLPDRRHLSFFFNQPMTLKPAQAGLQAAMSSPAGQGATSPMSKEVNTPSSTSQAHEKKVQNLVDWVAEGEIDIQAVIECSQEIISLYEVWDPNAEKLCKEQIARFVKARGLDK
ncbi:hypothetical protein P7C71_g1433, partial [Lecanoromycetidae sp. Uapishka_2]